MMSTLTNIIYWAFSVYYWKDYMQCRKIKEVLKIFFEEESDELQKNFIENFDYPTNMTGDPVRYDSSTGEIYYILNFKSKELFENTGTQEAAYTNSLKILDKHLPIGVTSYLEPMELMGIPESPYSLFCSLVPITDTSSKKTILVGLSTVIISLVVLSMISLVFFGFYKIISVFF